MDGMKVEIRDNKLHLCGYVNAVERDSKVIMTRDGKCVEQIAAGAFARSLADGHEVRMKLNHRRDIGSTADGTIILEEDKIGLYAVAETEDEELRELAAAGKLTGWSFGFVKREGVMEERANDVPRRRINALDLSEVSILSVTPAYNGTSVEVRSEGEDVEVRSYDDYEESPAEKPEAAPEERGSMNGKVQCFLMDEKIKQMKARQRYYEIRAFVEEEKRYNPYHDPHNGQFTSGGGAMAIGALYVPKGWAGKGQYLGSSSPWQPKKSSGKSYADYENEISRLKDELAYADTDRVPVIKDKIKSLYRERMAKKKSDPAFAKEAETARENQRKQIAKEREEYENLTKSDGWGFSWGPTGHSAASRRAQKSLDAWARSQVFG